jgi:hypothetical protein
VHPQRPIPAPRPSPAPTDVEVTALSSSAPPSTSADPKTQIVTALPGGECAWRPSCRTILGQEGFSRLARRSIPGYGADRLQPGPATGTPRWRFLEWTGSSPLSESVIARYADGGAAASMSSSAQRCRIRPLAKCTVESDTAPRLPSACGSGPDGNPPTEGVRRPEGPGCRAGLPSEATRQHAHRIPLSDWFTTRADNASVQRTEGACRSHR